ncbi:sensor histidine kinase [Horticoccus sp. 23ND18S-11]|uniref:sensor histidine kinase n=1 Tax=Horticoccus sp. 23ND18S-11 TaxID=3391832 RepID=UPI0039C94FE9
MPPASRRIFLYWLLLLVPALVVGGAAIFLLQNERQRVVQSGVYAEEARRAAIAARARLIVENVELLVGDVETGLLDVLAAEPAADVAAFLLRWEKSNPLVRISFLSTPDGAMIHPDARTAGEDARGFLRRFSQQFGGRPPWAPPALAEQKAAEKREQERTTDESAARKDVSMNVAQVQSARRNVQDLLKTQNQYASGATATAPAAPAVADAASSRSRGRSAPLAEADRAERSVASSKISLGANAAAGVAADKKAAPVGDTFATSPVAAAPAPAQRSRDLASDRRGWVPTRVDGRFQLLGWVQPGGAGLVRGVELELAALVSRLGSALPVDLGSGEGYALRDEQGRILHQAGAVPREGEPTVRVPFAAALLPGWDVIAYALPGPAGSAGGGDFFWAGVLLVVLFVAAILAGGSLLLRQARRSEEEAAQKTSFVANVSHEFKTPLTTIRLYAELLEQGRVRDPAQGGDYLRTIGRETQRLARLVNNALDFSRLEQGQKKYARVDVDVVAELTRLVETHAPRVADAGLVLQRVLPATPLRVSTDRDALEQIVLNLIDNACKYAAGGGEITVSARARSDGGVEVSVADRGPGVPVAHRERIFDKFHRVDDALTAEKTGAGLGLSIARQLARGLGGDLRYVPRAGSGAEFILELP